MNKKDFKILIAEDDAMVQDVIEKLLTDEGYCVLVANDGVEAIKMLRMENISLVLSDLRMPGADGMEVLHTAVKVNPNISVVILTAYGTLDTALEAMKAGAYDYIVKPFVMQQLILVVRNAFNLCNLLEDNEVLKGLLRDACRDLENIKEINKAEKAPVLDNVERLDKIKELDLMDSDDSGKTNTEQVPDMGDVKKYGMLIKDIKGFNG